MSNVTTKTPKIVLKPTPPSVESEFADAGEIIQEPKAAWNPVLGAFLAAIIFFGAQLISGILISYYRYPKHWTSQQLLNWLNNAVSAQFFFILFAEVLVVLGVYFFVRRYKDGLRAIGIRPPRWSDPLFGFLALPVYLFIYLVAFVIIKHLVPSLNVNEKQQLGFNNVSGVGQMTATFVSLVILPPIGEEILFRGLLYSSLKKYLPIVVAAIGTSALFAIGHLDEGGGAGPLYIAAIDTFILSLVLVFLREKTGSLWSSMTLHALKNAMAFIALFVAFAR